MDPAFEAATIALQKPGDLSEPIKSRFGYHLIRLNDKKPPRQLTFEEASPDILEQLKAEFIETRRGQAVRALYDPSKIKWNEPAVIGLKKRVDPALLKAATQ